MAKKKRSETIPDIDIDIDRTIPEDRVKYRPAVSSTPAEALPTWGIKPIPVGSRGRLKSI